MVSEKDRLMLLRLASLALFDMDRIQAELKKRGYDLSESQIRNALDELRKVRGTA